MTSDFILSISIIVPVYNGGEDFHKCLKHLLVIDPKPKEIVIVSDGDTDGSGELARSFGLQVIRNDKAQGPAIARNQGAKFATGDILFFIDADITVPSDVVAKVSNLFQKDSKLTALFGSYDELPGHQSFLSQYKNLFHHYVHQNANTEASTFWSGCGAIKRDIFNEFGGFSSSYKRPAIEDIELGYRLRAAGHRIFLDKSLQVKHLKKWTSISLFKTDFFQRALPWTELILKRKVLTNDLNLNYSSRLSVVLIFTLITSLPVIYYIPVIFIFTFLCVIGLLALNIKVYKFFFSKKGLFFTLLAITWHWFYYFYSGIAFIVGILKVYLNK